MYRFCRLNNGRSEWMAILLPSTNHDPNEPHPPEYPGGTRWDLHYSIEVERPRLPKGQYKIRETAKGGIEVTVPFVPWEIFESSPFYQAGLTYRDYMDMITDGIGYNNHYQHRSKLCCYTKQSDLREWKISGMTEDSRYFESRSGFFGGIPSGKTLFMLREASPSYPLEGKHIVSTRWHDWKNFALQSMDPETAPKIVLPSGEAVPCLGVITGHWANEDDFDVRWDIEAYVVDATIKDETGQQFNFAISGHKLALDNAYVCEWLCLLLLVAILSTNSACSIEP